MEEESSGDKLKFGPLSVINLFQDPDKIPFIIQGILPYCEIEELINFSLINRSWSSFFKSSPVALSHQFYARLKTGKLSQSLIDVFQKLQSNPEISKLFELAFLLTHFNFVAFLYCMEHYPELVVISQRLANNIVDDTRAPLIFEMALDKSLTGMTALFVELICYLSKKIRKKLNNITPENNLISFLKKLPVDVLKNLTLNWIVFYNFKRNQLEHWLVDHQFTYEFAIGDKGYIEKCKEMQITPCLEYAAPFMDISNNLNPRSNFISILTCMGAAQPLQYLLNQASKEHAEIAINYLDHLVEKLIHIASINLDLETLSVILNFNFEGRHKAIDEMLNQSDLIDGEIYGYDPFALPNILKNYFPLKPTEQVVLLKKEILDLLESKKMITAEASLHIMSKR